MAITLKGQALTLILLTTNQADKINKKESKHWCRNSLNACILKTETLAKRVGIPPTFIVVQIK